MAKRYYWLKLKEGFFQDLVIQKLRQMEHGDTLVIIYLKLLLLSLKTNGELIFKGVGKDLVDELILQLSEPAEDVKAVTSFLMEHGLLCQLSDSDFELPIMSELTGSETESAERMRQKRARDASQCDEVVMSSDEKATPPLLTRDSEKKRPDQKQSRKNQFHNFSERPDTDATGIQNTLILKNFADNDENITGTV